MRRHGTTCPGRAGLALLACSWFGFVSAVSRADDLDATSWSAKVDPPARAVPTPTNKSFAIPFPGNFGHGNQATYPAVPSPFVAIGKNFFDNDVRQVWDLSTKKQVGAVKGPLGWDDKTVALSADGTLIVGKTNRKMIEVRNTRTGKIAQTFDADGPVVDFIEFAGSDRVIYGHLHDRRLRVGAVKSGDAVCELRLADRVPTEGFALSPGGAYLAAASNGQGQVELHDTQTGQVVAEVPTPRLNGAIIHCAGVAFAPDGTELAGLFESFGTLHLVIWDAASGRMMDHFDLGKTVQKPTFYTDRGVDWFPDKSALLVMGHAVVDRQAGKKVWNLPFDDKNLKVSPRHFLDADHAVVVSFNPGMALRTADIPRDRIAAAATIVREGGNAADASLPPLRPVDLAAARRVELAGASGAWAVAAGSSPVAPKRLTTRAVNLKNKADEARAFLFAGRESTVAAVYGTASKPNADDPSDGQPRWFERFDLTGGRALGAIELPAPSNPIALAPDGATVLVREAKARDRLDLFDTADARPVVGWRPYGQESGDGRAVLWADFLAPKRVATLSGGGVLVVWSLPDLKVDYVVEDAFHGTPSLSPDRRRIAGFDGKTLRVLDAATGELVGEGGVPANLGVRPDWKGGAFRPDGLAYAGQFGTSTLVRWDLATGRVAAEVRAATMLPADPIEWLGDHHVLLNNRTLVDFVTKRVVWEYLGAPIGAPGPDGKHWFVARGELGKDNGRLLSLDAADPGLDRAEARLADVKSPAVLRPGARVSVQVDAAGPTNDPAGYRKTLAEALAARLKANGMTVVEDGPPGGRSGGAVRVSFPRAAGPDVRLVLTVREQHTGENIQFQGIGMGRGQVETVPVVNLVCDMTLVDATGSVGCGTAYTAYMRPFGFILHMPPGETMAGPYLRKLQWEWIKSWTANAVPPYFVARDGAAVIRLPGYTDMNQLK